MPQTTGSDTRIYNPRSESMLGYSKDEDYRHGIGDPKAMEEYRDKKQAEKEAEPNSDDLPHLQIEVPKPAPEMPPMMPEEEEEEPMMDDQFNEGQQFGAMTGMPDMGNLSIGNATGTMPQPGGTLMTGEPMEDAWSTLLKIDAELPPPMTQGVEEQLPMQEDIPMVNVNTDNYETPCECAERVRTQMITDTQEMLNELKNTLPSGKPIPSHGDLYLNDIVYAYEETISDLEILNCEEILQMAESNPKYAHMCQDNQGFSESEQMMYTGEPMEDAWSTLMKSRLDNVKGAKDQSWKQPQYETQPGGADITTANTRRAKLQSRYVQPSKKRGLDRAPLSVHRSHLGIATKQPLRLFPQKYGQQMGSMARRKLMGNIPTAPAGHAMGPETTYSPKTPKVASGAGLPLKEPRAPMMRGQALAKSELELIKQDLEELKKKDDYMRFAQIRRLLRQLKDVAERQERRLKASAGPGEVKESGHREGQDSTTRPEGATEDMENDPKNWGAPSTIFAARGSGRVG